MTAINAPINAKLFLNHKNSQKMSTTIILKFTKVKCNEIRVSFRDLISSKDFFYSKNLATKPTMQDRQDYLREVLSGCNFINTTGLKPIKY